MNKTTEQVQAMKGDLQAWLEKNNLEKDTSWHDFERHYDEQEASSFAYPHYLVLGFDGRFYDLLLGKEWPPEPGKFKEFQAIIDKHGCWFEIEEAGIMAILDSEPRD